MANTLVRVSVHAVWTTWARTPWIDPRTEAIVRDAIFAQGARLKCSVLAFGAADDHVHVLGELNATTALATWVRAMKGASAHAATTHRGDVFRWQEGYGAFSVSIPDLDRVAAYVRDQRAHHAASTLDLPYEP